MQSNLTKEAKFLGIFGKEPPIYEILLTKENEVKERLMERQQELRDYLHESRMAFKNVEYPRVLHSANMLRKTVDDLFDFSGLREEIEKALTEFHGNTGLTREQLEELAKELKQESKTKEIKKSNIHSELFAEATAMQWIKEHLPTSKEIDSKFYEKIFKNMLSKQKEGARTALRIAENIFNATKEIFKKLKETRNDFNRYIAIINNFKQTLNSYKATLISIYNQPEFQAALDPNNHPIAEVSKPATQEVVIQEPVEPEPVEVKETLPEEKVVEPIEEKKEPITTPIDLSNKTTSAASVFQLVKRAQAAIDNKDYGIAAGLLTKASEICDNNGDEVNAIFFLNAADLIINK
jgi:hypothetical protein